VEPIIFEQGDKTYFVGPLAPMMPSQQDIEEYAFGKTVLGDLKAKAPNEHISWFSGHYVEADTPNKNGAQWTASEIAVKSLTPMFMPVTVMHDPATAVGVIADLVLRTPEKDGVQRSKIETALALWGHRFPDAVAEAQHNYQQGTLMQSMECLTPDYECGSCGAHFHKLPHGAEQEQWCAHLKGEEGSTPVRILKNVIFTGTGLIYGSRGAQGADPSAHLEAFQEEVAEFHQRGHTSTTKKKPSRSKPKMDEVTISKSEYDRLVRERDENAAKVTQLQTDVEAANAAKSQAEKDLEAAETAKVAAEQKATEAETAKAEAERTVSEAKLRDERMEELSTEMTSKLGEKTKARLHEQASTLTDEEWASRIEEIEEMTGVKRDAEGSSSSEREFSSEETARFKGGHRGNGTPTDLSKSPEARRSVVGALISK
jgi:hypothetical protein